MATAAAIGTAVGMALLPSLIGSTVKGGIQEVKDIGELGSKVFSGKPVLPAIGNFYKDTAGNIANIATNTVGIGDVYSVNDTSQQVRAPRESVKRAPVILSKPVNEVSGSTMTSYTGMANMRDFYNGPELGVINPQDVDLQKAFQQMLMLRGMPPQNLNVHEVLDPGLSALAPPQPNQPFLELGINAEPVPEPIGSQVEDMRTKRLANLAKARATRKANMKKKGGKKGGKKGAKRGRKKKVTIV